MKNTRFLEAVKALERIVHIRSWLGRYLAFTKSTTTDNYGIDRMTYKNTFWMNSLSAVAWFIFYVSLILNEAYSTESDTKGLLVGLTTVYTLLVLTFSLTAYVLARNSKHRLNLLAEGLNYSIILLVLLPLIRLYSYCCSSPSTINDNAIPFLGITALIFIAFFVVPSIINLKTLKQIKSQD